MAAYLRVFPRTEEESAFESPQEATVRIRLGDLFPLLAQAHRGKHIWLQDFQDDEVVITSDLYDVLTAFRCYRPSA